MKTALISNQPNANGAQFTDDFIDGVIENKDDYISIPFQVDRTKLENGLFGSLTHKLDKKTGQLLTDTIGSFVDFEKAEIDGANCLIGTARIFKRYPKTCEAILKLYEDNSLETSVEVMVSSYEQEDGVRKVNYEGNYLIGQAIVTVGAEDRAKPSLLVAEALQEDLKGGASMDKQEREFNSGKEIAYHFESASIKLSEIGTQLYSLLNPYNERGYRDYKYYIQSIYNDYAIVEDEDTYNVYYRVPYSIEDDKVVLAEESEWVKGKIGFIPDGVNYDTVVAEKEEATVELNNKIKELEIAHKEELDKMSEEVKVESAELEAKVAELAEKIEELTTKNTELSELVVSQKEEITSHETSKTELAEQVESLKPFKEQVEKAEQEAKRTELAEKYGAILSEEAMQSERVVKALEELNTTELAEVVVEEAMKAKTEVASKKVEKKDEDVVVVASKQEDLVHTSLRDKMYASKSE
jgi:chemotaxis protein histidine kinase CheA